MTAFKDRLPYSAIIDRPKLQLPGGARMAVWTIVNVENWDCTKAQPRTVLPPPMGKPLVPDLANWSWHEYGMRVGFWRIYDCLTRLGVIPTMALNGIVCENYPRIADAAKEAGWEFMGHGYVQGPMHHVDDQRDAIRRTIDTIRDFTGKGPRGWESPGLTETEETIDILADEGIEYVADWVLDDQPCRIATETGSMISVPYTLETNDIPIFALQNQPSDAMLKRTIDQFEQMYAESDSVTRIMAISVHSYLSGVPHRIGYLKQIYEYVMDHPGVVMMTGEEIHDWYLSEEKRLGL
ncbi:MAG: polysaccharide deacetylase family protein [Proteobacteria bacterium]|nr:polysaccharide deacetylase family protein [Pseudomonadota bacterium]